MHKMSESFLITDITLGDPSYSSGHEAYLRACYNPPDQSKPYKVIYKKNKHGRSEFSQLEVTFSQLAKLFLLPGITSSVNLVKDNKDNVMGLAVQHLAHVIEKKEGLEQNFFSLNALKTGVHPEALKVTEATKIPIYFFEKVPQGFFAKLIEAEKQKRLTIDYESFASLLATSYTLEEDDLHRGNYGFYLVEKRGKPRVVFFKIDHDLMFVDSIMGFKTRRPFHLHHSAHAFDITAEDLLSLTELKYSSNSYWPTKFCYFSNPFNNKEYHSFKDIAAFSSLGQHPKVIKGKWKSFLKHILITEELIKSTLEQCANQKNAQDRAHIALMQQTLQARIAHLKAVLFSVKEFRDYVSYLSPKEAKVLMAQTIPSQLKTEERVAQLSRTLVHYQDLCKTNVFVEGDTPLHTAIKLGEYRYEETLEMFSSFIQAKNSLGLTPLDIACARINTAADDPSEVQKNACFISKHLLTQGAWKTQSYVDSGFLEKVEHYVFENPYKVQITANMRYKEFKALLRDIGEDHRFGLKFKKNLALECIKHFVALNKNHPDAENRLLRLRDDVNGKSSEASSAGLKYLRQLRSKLWIIRQIRGLYGLSFTQWEINAVIRDAQADLRAQKPSCFAFFNEESPRRDGKNIELTSLALN